MQSAPAAVLGGTSRRRRWTRTALLSVSSAAEGGGAVNRKYGEPHAAEEAIGTE